MNMGQNESSKAKWPAVKLQICIYTCILFQIQFNSLELKTQMNFSDRLLPLKFVCPFACLSVYYMKRCCNVFTNVFNVKEAKLHGEV